MNTQANKPRATCPAYIGGERNIAGTTVRDAVNDAIDKLEVPSFENARKVLESLAPKHLQNAYSLSLISAPERS